MQGERAPMKSREVLPIDMERFLAGDDEQYEVALLTGSAVTGKAEQMSDSQG